MKFSKKYILIYIGFMFVLPAILLIIYTVIDSNGDAKIFHDFVADHATLSVIIPSYLGASLTFTGAFFLASYQSNNSEKAKNSETVFSERPYFNINDFSIKSGNYYLTNFEFFNHANSIINSVEIYSLEIKNENKTYRRYSIGHIFANKNVPFETLDTITSMIITGNTLANENIYFVYGDNFKNNGHYIDQNKASYSDLYCKLQDEVFDFINNHIFEDIDNSYPINDYLQYATTTTTTTRHP